VPASPPLAERAQVLAAFGEALITQARFRESRELCEEAIAIAGQIGALVEEGDARRALGVDLAFLGDLEAGVGELAEARRIVEAVGTVDQVARTFATWSGLLETFGRLEAAAGLALEGAELAASQGLGRWHGPFLTATAARALFGLGRWDDAEVLLGRAADRVAPELAATWVYIHTARGQLDLARGRAGAAAEHLAVARDAYAQTVTQPWFATPLFVATAELAVLEGRLPDADAAVAEGLRVAGADPGYAAPLYALGLRAAADRAELARARRDDEEVLEARRAGDTLTGQLQARLSPEGADGAVPTPRTEAQAVLCQAELARLDGRTDPDLWEAAAKAWERLGEPYPTSYARWRQARRCCSAASAASRSSRRCGPRTRRRSGSARPHCAPRSRPWPAAAGSTWGPRPRPRPRRSRHRRSTRSGSPPASRRCWPWWRSGGPTPRSPRPCSSAPRRPPCTSPTSSPSWASATGSRRPPSPTGSGSCSRSPDRRVVRYGVSILLPFAARTNHLAPNWSSPWPAVSPASPSPA
ncbi:MAG TPA: hypothetical protein VIJ13_01035, partial [Actinomycetota bacterium]